MNYRAPVSLASSIGDGSLENDIIGGLHTLDKELSDDMGLARSKGCVEISAEPLLLMSHHARVLAVDVIPWGPQPLRSRGGDCQER